MGSKTMALIPAYNEELTIASVIKGVKKYVKKRLINKILVVDDASTDRTAEIARKAGADVITHVINRGYGGAQRTGQKIALMEGYDYIVQLDGDGQHNPKYIPKLLETLKNNDYDMVLGSRFLNQSYRNFSFTRRMGIKFFTWLTTFSVNNARITDITSGYKVYKTDILKKLSRSSDRHPAVEQMMEMIKKGVKIKEVSVVMPLRKKSESHLNRKNFILYPFRIMFLIIKVILFR